MPIGVRCRLVISQSQLVASSCSQPSLKRLSTQAKFSKVLFLSLVASSG